MINSSPLPAAIILVLPSSAPCNIYLFKLFHRFNYTPGLKSLHTSKFQFFTPWENMTSPFLSRTFTSKWNCSTKSNQRTEFQGFNRWCHTMLNKLRVEKWVPVGVWDELARLVWHMLVRHHYALDITSREWFTYR